MVRPRKRVREPDGRGGQPVGQRVLRRLEAALETAFPRRDRWSGSDPRGRGRRCANHRKPLPRVRGRRRRPPRGDNPGNPTTTPATRCCRGDGPARFSRFDVLVQDQGEKGAGAHEYSLAPDRNPFGIRPRSLDGDRHSGGPDRRPDLPGQRRRDVESSWTLPMPIQRCPSDIGVDVHERWRSRVHNADSTYCWCAYGCTTAGGAPMPIRAPRPWTGATRVFRCPVRASRRVGMCTSRTPSAPGRSRSISPCRKAVARRGRQRPEAKRCLPRPTPSGTASPRRDRWEVAPGVALRVIMMKRQDVATLRARSRA